jgi:hypothetical protein
MSSDLSSYGSLEPLWTGSFTVDDGAVGDFDVFDEDLPGKIRHSKLKG